MDGPVLPPLIWLFSGSLTMLILIYCVAVTRALPRQHEGGRPPPFWRVRQRFHLYREIRASRSESLGTYYVAIILMWFTVLLAAAILLVLLWDRTHPLS